MVVVVEISLAGIGDGGGAGTVDDGRPAAGVDLLSLPLLCSVLPLLRKNIQRTIIMQQDNIHHRSIQASINCLIN